MFSSALVESCGTIRTSSRYWMLATGTLNVAVVAAIALVPLLYPEALPKSALQTVLTAPLPPAPDAPTPPHMEPMRVTHTVQALNPYAVPTVIPHVIRTDADDRPPSTSSAAMTNTGVAMGDVGPGVVSSLGVGIAPIVRVATPAKKERERVSGGVMAGQIISKTVPIYPPIARAARVYGSVVLHAIISKNGTIEKLSVESGPEMLRAAAVDAVRTWRYRPYLLGGSPVEVDTNITVNFNIGQS